jgi:hypothetical protein
VRQPALCSLIALGFLACGGSPPELSKQLDTVRSWTATVQLASAERSAGSTNGAVTTQLHERAQQALTQARDAVTQGAHSAADRARAESTIDSLDAAIRHLDAATVAR